MCKGDVKEMVAGPITVVQLLPELNAGGVERGTLELGRYLSAKGHKSIVISAGGRFVSLLEKEGSRHIAWDIGKKSPTGLSYILPLRRLLVREKVDILHARSRLPAWIGYAAWKSLPHKTRPGFVTTFHGYYSVNRYSAVMTKGERIIAISRAIASHIIEKYGVSHNRITLIYRGVDDTVFDPDLVSEDRIRTLRHGWQLNNVNVPILMLPGRLTKWKGHDIFIKSLARIKSLPWIALCVGDKDENRSYGTFLEKLIFQEGLADKIRFVGHCEDMPAALMIPDVVVSASSTEPEAFGRIAVEAQAMGKPVIATAHGGSLETVLDGETGWLVNPCDVKELSAVLAETIQNRALMDRFGRRGRAWVKEMFTVRKMCENTLELYSRLIGEKADTHGES